MLTIDPRIRPYPDGDLYRVAPRTDRRTPFDHYLLEAAEKVYKFEFGVRQPQVNFEKIKNDLKNYPQHNAFFEMICNYEDCAYSILTKESLEATFTVALDYLAKMCQVKPKQTKCNYGGYIALLQLSDCWSELVISQEMKESAINILLNLLEQMRNAFVVDESYIVPHRAFVDEGYVRKHLSVLLGDYVTINLLNTPPLTEDNR